MAAASIIDQSEIDALLAEADGLAAESFESPAQAPATHAVPRVLAEGAPRRLQIKDPSVRRLLRIKVPVVVMLARRMMEIAAVRELSVGAIIEFEKAVEEPLDLMIGNQLIGHGNCVKVGENFGLRILDIVERRKRLESLNAP